MKRSVIVFTCILGMMCMLSGCYIFTVAFNLDTNMDNDRIKPVLTAAKNSGAYVAIAGTFSFSSQPTYKVCRIESVTKSSAVLVCGRERLNSGFNSILSAAPVSPGIKFAIQYGPSDTINGTVKTIAGSKMTFVSDKEYTVILKDKSEMRGRFTGYDFEKETITVTTKVSTINLAGGLISSIQSVNTRVDNPEVNIVLIDGTKRNGELIREEANRIVVKTILGIETFNRDTIYKIDYKKEK
jgi:hypothetical protein